VCGQRRLRSGGGGGAGGDPTSWDQSSARLRVLVRCRGVMRCDARRSESLVDHGGAESESGKRKAEGGEDLCAYVRGRAMEQSDDDGGDDLRCSAAFAFSGAMMASSLSLAVPL
jgi:hypothetical protein